MIVDKDRVQKAKEKLGDRTPGLIAEILNLREFDDRSLKALCPVHHEDTPSFIFNPKMNNFHCFGCGCNVDIIDAYMMTGDTYLTAVEKLFGEVGMTYSFGERGVKTQRNYVYPQEVEKRPRTKVDAYFATRKISKETMDHFDVREDEHGNAVFNYYDLNDVLTMVKYRPSHKIDKSKGEAKTWCQKGADTKPLLFNMNRVNASQPLLMTEGECLTPDAQVLTPSGWVALGAYDGQQVLQVNTDFSCEFVTPIAYINKWYDGDLYIKRTGRNYTSITTAGHNIVYVDCKGNIQKRRADEMPKNIGTGYIPTTVRFDGPGIPLSDDQIALYLAVSADCTIDHSKLGKRHCRFSVKKERKFERMKGLLERLGIKHFTNEEIKHRTGYKYIGFRTPDWIESKELPFSWVAEATLRQREFILREMVEWDGNHVPNRNQVEYSSKVFKNALLMQTIAHTCGYMSTIMARHNDYGRWLKVSILYGKHGVSHQKGFDEIIPYYGPVCCVTVPSGMILVRQEHSITVTGNCDTMAAYEAGFTNAVSVPFGSQNHHWIEENWDWLDQFSEIIVCGDNDQAGVKMIQDVCPRLGTWRTKVVDIPDTDEATGHRIKDLNELLYYKGKQAVMDVILNAKESPIDSVVDLSDVEDVNISDLDGVLFGVKNLDMELFKMFFGTLTLVTGRPGSGKTSFLYQTVCNVLEQGRGAWIFSRELPDFMSKSWMNYLLAGPRNVEECTSNAGAVYYRVSKEAKKGISDCYRGECYVYKNDWPNDIESIQESMEASARKYGSKLFLLDNLMTINLHSSDDNKYDKQTELVNWLIQFASKYNVAVILVAHPRKFQNNGGAVDLYDIGGSSNLVNLAHRTLSLRRVSKEEQEAGKTKFSKYSCVVSVTKDRLRGRAGYELGMFYDESCRRFFTNYEEFDRRYRWDRKQYNSPIPCPALEADHEVYGAPIATGSH